MKTIITFLPAILLGVLLGRAGFSLSDFEFWFWLLSMSVAIYGRPMLLDLWSGVTARQVQP